MHCSKEAAEEPPRAYLAGRQAERGQGVDLGRLSTRGDFNDSEETPGNRRDGGQPQPCLGQEGGKPQGDTRAVKEC